MTPPPAGSSAAPTGFGHDRRTQETPVLRLNLSIPPDWRHVRQLRDYINGVMQSFGKTHDFADRCAMCASELLENAVKYSYPESEIVARVDVEFAESMMHAVVENHAPPERLDDLEQVIEKVNRGGPFDSYVLLLTEAAYKEASTSQVGLGRVRAEGNAWLRCERLAPDRVRMRVGVPERRRHPTVGMERGRRWDDPK
jgi:hypothetical protein